MNPDLQRFVRDSLARNLSREAIREQLARAGWGADEIESALRTYAEADFPVPVPRRRPSLNAREAFLHLVLFATLYATAYNTGQVLFALIEGWIPDPAQRHQEWTIYGAWARSATAGLIIAFPVFLLFSWLIGREVEREPEKRGSAVRKWLTYLTLFLAAVIIIGDLTVLVTRVLGGELAPRFVLKVLVVFLIAAAIFGHYLGDLRRDEQATAAGHGPPGWGARLAAVAVVAAIVCGLLVSGPPRRERWRQIDAQRVEALQRISSAVESYHAARHRLPESLEGVLRVPDGLPADAILDPVTARRFEYRTLDSLRYELCAEFQTDDAGVRPAPEGAEFWRHGIGRRCFQFEIPERAR